MRKFIYSLIIVSAMIISCSPEQDELFSDSASTRLDASIKEDMRLLTAAENGWLMEMYPSGMQTYGGYNVLLSFSGDGSVEVASEFYGPDNSEVSLFSIKQSAGKMLSFDSYNSIIHLFSEPVNPLNWGSKGKGMEGDLDFMIIESSDDRFILKGKKSDCKIVMTKMPVGLSWSDYISQLGQAEEMMAMYKKYKYVVNGKEIVATVQYRTLSFTYDKDGAEVSEKYSYIQTLSGFKFYKPLEIDGVIVNELEYSQEDGCFKSSGVTMTGIIPAINEQFVSGDWFVKYSTLGEYGQTYFAHVFNNYYCPGGALDGETLEYAFIGSMLYGNFGFNFISSGYGGLLNYDYTLIDDDKVTLKFALKGEGNGVWYYSNGGFNYLINPFGNSSGRTFTITCDNPTRPTYIILTDVDNDTNVIQLWSEEVLLPYDK